MGVGFWVCAAITLVSATVSLGFAIAALRGSAGGTRTASQYALSRSVALVAVALIAPLTQSTTFLAAAAIAMIVVQAIDAVIGGRLSDRVKTVGPAATAVLNGAALVWLLTA